jgi:hypothetical protein
MLRCKMHPLEKKERGKKPCHVEMGVKLLLLVVYGYRKYFRRKEGSVFMVLNSKNQGKYSKIYISYMYIYSI